MPPSLERMLCHPVLFEGCLICLSMTNGRRRALAHASVANGELPSVRITLPTDIKNLAMTQVSAACALSREDSLDMSGGDSAKPYPNVAPEPSMYCPSVLMGPFGPPPYLIMVNPPMCCLSPVRAAMKEWSRGVLPYKKPMINPTASQRNGISESGRIVLALCHTASKHCSHFPC